MGTMLDIKRNRAQFAYDEIKNACNEQKLGKNGEGVFKAYLKKLPAMIINNGLTTSITFVYAKKENKKTENNKEGGKLINANSYAWFIIYEILTKWYIKNKIISGTDEMYNELINLQTQTEYRLATIETLNILAWLKRISEGYIEK